MASHSIKFFIAGDFHIPQRASSVPDWILEVLKKESVDYVLLTGDLVYNQVFSSLSEFCKSIYAVRGNMDFLPLPKSLTLRFDNFETSISLIHGDGIIPRGDKNQLLSLAKSFDSDILIHGHTHRMDVYSVENILFLNPGTATGVWGGSSNNTEQSFIILEIYGKRKYNVRKFSNGKELN